MHIDLQKGNGFCFLRPHLLILIILFSKLFWYSCNHLQKKTPSSVTKKLRFTAKPWDWHFSWIQESRGSCMDLIYQGNLLSQCVSCSCDLSELSVSIWWCLYASERALEPLTPWNFLPKCQPKRESRLQIIQTTVKIQPPGFFPPDLNVGKKSNWILKCLPLFLLQITNRASRKWGSHCWH